MDERLVKYSIRAIQNSFHNVYNPSPFCLIFPDRPATFEDASAYEREEYLSSAWFKIFAFGKEGEFLDSVPSLTTLANAAEGVRIEVKGRLGQEGWTNNAGETRSTLVIYATEVKTTAGTGAAAEEEPQP